MGTQKKNTPHTGNQQPSLSGSTPYLDNQQAPQLHLRHAPGAVKRYGNPCPLTLTSAPKLAVSVSSIHLEYSTVHAPAILRALSTAAGAQSLAARTRESRRRMRASEGAHVASHGSRSRRSSKWHGAVAGTREDEL